MGHVLEIVLEVFAGEVDGKVDVEEIVGEVHVGEVDIGEVVDGQVVGEVAVGEVDVEQLVGEIEEMH